MALRYNGANSSLFLFLGSLHKKYDLPIVSRQELGFLLCNAVDDYLYTLIKNTYYNDHNFAEKGLEVDEILSLLRSERNGRFYGRTCNQIIEQILEEESKLVKLEVEQEITDNRYKRSVQRLISYTEHLESQGILPDGD